LNGGAGADTLYGGAGNDAMSGGAGNDTYWRDAAGDTVTEGAGAGAGTDTVISTVNVFGLEANVENLTLSGTAVYGYGNGLSNVINGNGSNNVLAGFDGADTMNGNAGNDSMYGGNGNDVMNGGTGNDTLDGDAGVNTLTGGAGADRFVFDDRGAANRDTVTDFTAVDDTVVLANSLDAGLVGAISPGILGLSFLGGNVSGNAISGAWYFENQVFNLSGIYYYDGSGEVWYNPTNGLNGDEVVIGRLGAGLSPSLTNADFVYGG
jgi:Ca2+-binding RTX toxin-like protein